MNVNELLEAVDDLSEADLEHLVERALFVRARRRAPVLSAEETALLLAINQAIPAELHARYQLLLDKRDDDALTDVEYAELLDMSDRIEGIGVERIDALAKLATLRQVPLLKLMDELGVQNPGVR